MMKSVNLFGEHFVKVYDDTLDGVVWSEDGFRDKAELEWIYKRIAHIDNKALIDIGAGSGAFTLLATVHPALEVLAIEPVFEARAMLEHNAMLNGVSDRVQIFRFAAWSESGVSVINVPVKGRELSLATLGTPKRFKDYMPREVETQTIDSLDLTRICAIKIDVEGAELHVLRGAKKTLERHRPVMLVEAQKINTKQFGYHPNEIVDFLTGLGATVERVSHRDLGVWWNEKT